MNEIIEINGIKYQHKERKAVSRLSPMVNSILMMGAMMYSLPLSTGEKRTRTDRPEQQVNIVTEFELIQQKKSNLIRSQRNWVIGQFNKNYIKID